jgi:uncharacterized protein YjbJ (UPF0337 family)
MPARADDARKGLIDSVKGKAKEVVGAITKNGSLTAEGRLEQAHAEARKEAGAAEALAGAEAKQAEIEVINAKLGSVVARNRVNTQTTAEKNAAETERAAQTRTAEQAAQGTAGLVVVAGTKTIGGLVDARAARSEQQPDGETRDQRHPGASVGGDGRRMDLFAVGGGQWPHARGRC